VCPTFFVATKRKCLTFFHSNYIFIEKSSAKQPFVEIGIEQKGVQSNLNSWLTNFLAKRRLVKKKIGKIKQNHPNLHFLNRCWSNSQLLANWICEVCYQVEFNILIVSTLLKSYLIKNFTNFDFTFRSISSGRQ
jgi:hypothetical protein